VGSGGDRVAHRDVVEDADDRRALVASLADQGTAIVGIFHDVAVREALATRLHNVALPGVSP